MCKCNAKAAAKCDRVRAAVVQQQAGLVAQWCRDNESCLFAVSHTCNQASAAKAFTALIDKALAYSEHKAKPV